MGSSQAVNSININDFPESQLAKLPERLLGSKIFAGTAFRRVPAPLHP